MWKKRENEYSTVEEVFLHNMGVSTLQDVNAWFTKSYNNEYRLDKVFEAIDIINDFIDKPITIVGDYDVDGITSTSILMLGLKEYGCKNLKFRIPKRFSEGYGLNMTIVSEIDEGLVITTDNGIAQNEEIKALKDKGLTVIVIDHHLPFVNDKQEIIYPNADIIIDPNAMENSADFNGYCAAGLAYKLIYNLLGKENELMPKLLSLATLGTVADVMELKEENYVFVRNGIKKLTSNLTTTIGTYALVSTCNALDRPTATDIAFKIAPVINSSSRMADDGAKDAIRLLTTEDYREANSIAAMLLNLNTERKKLKTLGMEKAEEIIRENNLFFDIPMVINIPDTPEGIIGILAGSLAEKYSKPVICLTNTEDGVLRGSGRSCGNYDMKAELDKVSELLLKYGGHTGAAGLSVNSSNLEALRNALNKNLTNYECPTSDDILYDLEIEEKDIPQYIDAMEKYEPYGEGNPKPIYRIKNFECIQKYGSYKSLIGADKSIVKLFSNHSTAIGFGMAEDMAYSENPGTLELIGNLSNNFYKGNCTRQIEFNAFQQV